MEIDLHGEAMVGNIYAHTVGLAGHSPVFLGSADAIRWKSRVLVLTADHVIKDAGDDQLFFGPRPPVPLRLNEGQRLSPRGTSLDESHGRCSLPLRKSLCLILFDF